MLMNKMVNNTLKTSVCIFVIFVSFRVIYVSDFKKLVYPYKLAPFKITNLVASIY